MSSEEMGGKYETVTGHLPYHLIGKGAEGIRDFLIFGGVPSYYVRCELLSCACGPGISF